MNNSTNGRNGHRPVQVRGLQRSSVQQRKLVKVWHIRMVNRVLAACAAGFLPVASYILAHIESAADPRLWALVLAALAYSAPTLATWAASWTDKGHPRAAMMKAWGFTILLEGLNLAKPEISAK